MYTDKIIEISRYALPIMLGLAFALQLFTFMLCTSYKKKAADIHNTNKELFRSIKLRYTNSVKLNIPLADTESYVEKYLYTKGGPFCIAYRLDRFSGFLLCSSLLATIALYVRNFATLSRLMAFIATAICFYIFRSTLSTEKQMQLTVSYTTDYLDNTLKHRLTPEPLRTTRTNTEALNDDVTTNNASLASEKTKATKDITPIYKNVLASHGNSSKLADISKSVQNENADIIDAVLQEFLA